MEEIVEVVKFKIKILKCSQPTFWYSDKVGQEFSVVDVSTRDYYISDDKGSTHGVLIVDSLIIN
jgi:hypothetical protein